MMNTMIVCGDTLRYTDQSLSELLRFQGIDTERQDIAIAINQCVVPRAQWDTVKLKENDEIEIVQAKAGG